MAALRTLDILRGLVDELPFGFWDALVTIGSAARLVCLDRLGVLVGFGPSKLVTEARKLPLALGCLWRRRLSHIVLCDTIGWCGVRFFAMIYSRQQSLCASIIPKVLVVGEHFLQGSFVGAELLPLFRLEAESLLADQCVCHHDERQARAFDPELLELL